MHASPSTQMYILASLVHSHPTKAPKHIRITARLQISLVAAIKRAAAHGRQHFIWNPPQQPAMLVVLELWEEDGARVVDLRPTRTQARRGSWGHPRGPWASITPHQGTMGTWEYEDHGIMRILGSTWGHQDKDHRVELQQQQQYQHEP